MTTHPVTHGKYGTSWEVSVSETQRCRPDIDPPRTWADLLWHMANALDEGPAVARLGGYEPRKDWHV